jgi:hypothetical protein
MNPKQLETYSFWWSETRLLIAAAALFLGGVPPVYFVAPPAMLGITQLGLTAAWIVSGLASAYLLWRWYDGGQKVFGGKQSKDIFAFLVMIVSGINLGLTGIFGQNIGMSLVSGKIVFMIVGALYLWVAYHLFVRWNKVGKMF